MYLIFYLSIAILPSFSFSEQPFVELAKKVKPSVVNISIITSAKQKILQLGPGFYIPHATPERRGSGSGFVIDSKGLIVTNAHVVDDADTVQVQFSESEKFYKAKIIGKDVLSDIALLKITTSKNLKAIKMGDSSQTQVGEQVAAFGNPHGYGHTVTQGIISALRREIDDLNLFPLLQTDASINLGNSGGPLVNLKGEVIGVNNATSARAQGISFAIPINNVKTVLEDLKKYGKVRRSFLGVVLSQAGFHQKNGAFVVNIFEKGPADKAGIKIKDRIVEFNGKKIKSARQLIKYIAQTSVGRPVQIKILRKNKLINKNLILSPVPKKRMK